MKNLLRLSAILFILISGTALALTPAGTQIQNSATCTFTDSNGNQYPPVNTNIVITTVGRIYGVDVTPSSASKNDVPAGTAVTYPLTIMNTGNGNDTFSISTVSNKGWTVRTYPDLNGDKVLQSNEKVPVFVTPSLSPSGTYDVIVEVSVPASATISDVDVTRMTAISQGDPTKSDFAELTTRVGGPVISLTKSGNKVEAFPDEEITYTITVSNTGTTSAFNLKVTDTIPTYTTYVPQSIKVTNGSVNDVSLLSGNTLIEWNVGQLINGFSKTLEFRVRVDQNVPNAQELINRATATYEYPSGTQKPGINAEFKTTVKANPGITLTPDSSSAVEPGTQVVYAFTAVNTGNVPDTFDLNLSSSYGLTWTLYFDKNGNGQFDQGFDSPVFDSDGDTIRDTGQLSAGASTKLLAVTTIPAGTPDQSVDTTTVTGRSSRNSTLSSSVKLTTTVKAPKIVITKKVLPEGEQLPGTELTYILEFRNDGTGTAYSSTVTDTIPQHTTYVANSVTLNNVPKTDSPGDGDGVSVVGRVITINVGVVSPGASGRITFKVKID